MEEKMKKYEYVSLDIAKFIGAGSQKHRTIIKEYAAKGYRYVGFIPTEITDHGKMTKIDLIFETDEEKGSW